MIYIYIIYVSSPVVVSCCRLLKQLQFRQAGPLVRLGPEGKLERQKTFFFISHREFNLK